MSLPERLSSSSGGKEDHHPSNAARRERDKEADPPDASVAGLVQRCVIIQKDEKGYGFTVTGDNPVFVASVKPDGAASRAGVQNNDRIVKVNGTLVTSRNHLDVVKLIKSGSYVALTLLGKPQNSAPASQPMANASFANTSINRDSMAPGVVTAPVPVNADKDRELIQHRIHMTKAMHDAAMEEYQKFQHQFARNPSEKLRTQLLEKERTVKTLDNQLHQLTGEEPKHSSNLTTLISRPNRYSDSEHGNLEHLAGQSWASSLPSATSDLSSMSDSPHTSPSISPTPNDALARQNGQESEDSNLNSMRQEIIHDDDEDMSADDVQVNDPGPYADIKLLENEPAHMAVLLNYLISNMDPAPVLFHIITNAYSRCSASIKDLRKWGYEIYSTFIAQGCPLNIGLDDKENVINQIDNILIVAASRTDNESALRNMFHPARISIQGVISDLLADFCNKRDLGMGNIYGSEKVHDNMDKATAAKVAESILQTYLEGVGVGLDDVNSSVNDKDLATGWALATFLRLNGVGSSKSSHSSITERFPTFMMKDKKGMGIKFPVSRSGRAKNVKSHQFTHQHFYVTTICNRCGHLVWGVGYQGYQCQSCEMAVHKQCVDDVTEVCGGKKSKRISRFQVSNPRKPSTVSQTSVISNQSIGSATDNSSLGSAGPEGGIGGPSIQPIPRDDEGDLAGIPAGHSVMSMVNRYEENGPWDRTSTSPMTLSTTSSGFDGLEVPTPSPSGPAGSLGMDVRNERRSSTDLNRSGSLNNKGEKGDRRARRAKSDVEMDSETFKAINQSGSSSTSSMSNRSGESPSTSTDNVREEEELDRDVEPELPPLKQILGEDVLRKLKPKEKKRQEVINELMYTERFHLRNLRVLDKIFNQPMLSDTSIMKELAKALFPNLDEMVKLHESITKDFKDRREENTVITNVGDILLKRFDGESGDAYRKGCAKYCRNQVHALEALKRQTRKEIKLAQFLTDAESKPVCRRLHLKDLVPSQMQRLTKYPLLIENLLKYTNVSSEEHKQLQRAHERCKHILSYVNQAVKECENYHKLKEIEKKLDKKSVESSNDSELKNLKLVDKKLIFDGPLTWKLKQNRSIDLHVLLLEDMLILLQKQDDKYLLKYQNSNVPSMRDSTRDEHKFTHGPVLKLQNLLARDVATEEKAFFIVNMSELRAQMYQLTASTKELREKWSKLINERAEELKKMENERPAGTRPVSTLPVQRTHELDVDTAKIGRQTLLSDPGNDTDKGEMDRVENLMGGLDRLDNLKGEDEDEEEEGLVQPGEVCVSNIITSQATAVRTPLELLRHNSDLITSALEERDCLLAQVLDTTWTSASTTSTLPQPPLSSSSSSSATSTTAAVATSSSTSSSSSTNSLHPTPNSNPCVQSVTEGNDKDVSQSVKTVEEGELDQPSQGKTEDRDSEWRSPSHQDEDGHGPSHQDEDEHDDNNNLEQTLLMRAVAKVKDFILLVMQAENESFMQQKQQRQVLEKALDEGGTTGVPAASPPRRMSGLSPQDTSADGNSKSSGQTDVTASPAASPTKSGDKAKVSMPLDQLKEMMTEMNSIMAKLMNTVNSGKEEKKRLHQELKEARAKLDILKGMQKQMIITGAVPPDRFTDDDGVDDQGCSSLPTPDSALLSSPSSPNALVRPTTPTSPPQSPVPPTPPPQHQQQQQPSKSDKDECVRDKTVSSSLPPISPSKPSTQGQPVEQQQQQVEEAIVAEVHHGIQEAMVMTECVETLDSVPSTETATVVGHSHARRDNDNAPGDDKNKVIEIAMDDDDYEDNNVSVADLPLPDMASVPPPASHDGGGDGGGGGSEVDSMTGSLGLGMGGLLDNVELEESDEDDSETVVGRSDRSDVSRDSVQAVVEGSKVTKGQADQTCVNDEEEEEFDDAVEM